MNVKLRALSAPRRAAMAVTAALALLAGAGCTTVVDPITRNAPLKLALGEPVTSLEEKAAAGDRSSQYALSFLLRFGARGVAPDPLRAESLRAQAGATHTRTVPIYVPGVKGAPGSLIQSQISDPGVSDAQARLLDLCGLTLLMGNPALGGQICGSPAAYSDLLPAAQIARQESLDAALAPVDPQTIADCAGVQPLWSDAARRLNHQDKAGAAAATDRIIALCGEAEASWHPRVMRALIAVDDGEADKALDLLRPVPRPAPAPIGGYASFVAMRAHLARQDAAAHGEERDRLIQAAIAAVSADPLAKSVGVINVGDVKVALFERPTVFAPQLSGLVVGLVQGGDGARPPVAFWLTTSPDPISGDRPVYFLDEYGCDGKWTLQYFPREGGRPDIAEVKALIEQRLRGTLEPTSGSRFSPPLNACVYPPQVAPDLGDGVQIVTR